MGRRWRLRALHGLDRLFPVVGLPLHVLAIGSLVLIILGVSPRYDAALYITALSAGVIFAGYTLLMSGMGQTDSPASDQDARDDEG
jgi:hypothetical protein